MKHLLSTATLAAAVLAAPAHANNYALDPTHTFVVYEIGHFGTSTNRGRGVAMLDKHLQSADFFDSASHPKAKFVGDKFSFDGDKVTQVAGLLTLRGKTQPVVLKATNFNCYMNPMFKREVCGGDFQTTIKRSQWGVNWGLNMGFPDEVNLLIQVEAIKQ